MAFDLLASIETLSGISGVSGREDAVRDVILPLLQGKSDCHVDPLGNILAFKKGKATPKNKILLSAHMDEVGFIITFIEDSGLLRFTSVGGIDSRVVVGKSVEVGDKRIYGVIGTKAVHLQEDQEKSEPQKLDKLYIDIGAKDKEDALRHAQPGDRAVFHAPFLPLGDDMIMGKALDDRAGCGVLLALIHTDLPYDCHFAFTVQEETGCTGCVTAGYSVNPDISLVIETTTASDIAGVNPDKVVCKLGNGPVVSFMDRGAIYDHGLYALALETANANNIPCQVKEGVFGGNESRSIQVARQGVRTLAVSMPCRYLHSPANVLQKQDILNTAALVERLIPAVAEL